MLWSIVTPLIAGAESEWEEWKYHIPIQADGSNPYKSLFLTEDVYEQATTSLDDLRIVDSRGEAVPYFLQDGFSDYHKNIQTYESEQLTSVQKGNDTIIDFFIKPIRENEDINGNRISLDVPEENFLKHLVIYGSYDGNEWEELMTDYIYRADSLEKMDVRFPRTYKYEYYRVRLLDNGERLSISHLQLSYLAETLNWEAFQKSTTLQYERKEIEQETIITIENPQRLKLTSIDLELMGNFQRTYEVFGDGNRRINVNGSSEFFNFTLEETLLSNTSIEWANTSISDKQLTIVIQNQDNPSLPLEGISVEYAVDKLVFEDNGNGPFYLHYGNPDAQKPNYDIEQFRTYIEKEAQDLLILGEQVKKVGGEEDINTAKEWNWSLIFNILVGMISVLLIAFLLVKMRKKE